MSCCQWSHWTLFVAARHDAIMPLFSELVPRPSAARYLVGTSIMLYRSYEYTVKVSVFASLPCWALQNKLCCTEW